MSAEDREPAPRPPRENRRFVTKHGLRVLIVLGLAILAFFVVTDPVELSNRKKLEFVTATRIALLQANIERYREDFKRLPPMSMRALAKEVKGLDGIAVDGNVTNDCSEALFVALQHPELTVPLGDDLAVEARGNTDQDTFNRDPFGGDGNAYEILDGYGNPIIYIHKDHYGTPVSIVLRDGTEIEANAVKKKDGTYYNQESYQLISLGANQRQDDPDDLATWDDLRNFSKRGRP